MKSQRNKTIDFSQESGKEYIQRCIREEDFSGGAFDTVKNTTVLGDSISFMQKMPDRCADLVIVDPPYNMRKDFDGLRFREQGVAEYREYTQKWVCECKRIMKDNASIYVCCDWKSSMIVGEVLAEEFILQNRITWQREKGRGALSNWKNGLEDVWFATKSDTYTFNVERVKIRRKVLAPYKVQGVPKDWREENGKKYRDTFPSNFWDDITVPYWSMPENTKHPTQKSEKMLAKMILASSNENDLIFDPFLGSGTTSVVAKKLNRNYIGVEQNPLYCAWAEYRLALADTDKTIQGYEEGIFWERNSYFDQKRKKKNT